MQVSRSFPLRPPRACALTIGNFDGVHLGHQALLRLVVERARARGLTAAVMIFEPQPLEFFRPAEAPPRLTPLREKLKLLATTGIDHVHVCRFDARLAALSADDFVHRLLVDGLHVAHLVIGDDFRFGHRRQGDFAHLVAAGQRCGFSVEAMPTLPLGGVRVSSSAVRAALAAGDMARATALLGQPYRMAGRVVRGRQLGRTLGMPTANLAVRHHRPALGGVFVVRAHGIGDAPIDGVANLGVRPSVTDDPRPFLEVHLFDWHGDCYGAHLCVEFLHKLRDEQRFASLDALTAQIHRDADDARAWLAAHHTSPG